MTGLDLGEFGYYRRPLCLDFGVGLAVAWLVRDAGMRFPADWARLSLVLGVAAFVAGVALSDHLSTGWLGAAAGALCAVGSGAIICGLVGLERGGRLPVPRRWCRSGRPATPST